ncbi:MAG: bifunctional folylpolyglutamate synthase/dihydrofolate synthase [Alphaproteobacteria bacterium]|nr:MAG: bifunctional folylpolyglutamate synthase/dihydrofolate synthase [Alphaproteobacteria bacterium]
MTLASMTPVDSILARLLALHPKRIDLTLARIERVLERLGSPQRRVPPVIHVAGTNGKGSTIAFLRAMLEAAGKSVHVYTSPNLVRINERFRLGAPGGGVLVSDEELADALAECERANGDAPITIFEIETAAAFVLFARHPADMLLLEVGLGGRLDATNVMERPLASVVTPVSMDHIEFLGDTIEKIAAEKAGIFRAAVPAVIAPQTEAVSRVLERHAEKARAPLHAAGQQWHAGVEHGRLVYQDDQGLLDLPPPKLFGRHQFDNAGTAIAALRAAGIRLPATAIEQGLMRAEWPARLQRLTTGKLVSFAPAGAELWLDGGHNADGGRAIAAALGDLEERVSRPLVLVVGMLSTKDHAGFLRNFTGLVRRVFAVPIHQDKGVPVEEIAAAARAAGMPADASPTIEEALAAASRLGFDPPPRILITGSLYLAGEVLAANGTELV